MTAIFRLLGFISRKLFIFFLLFTLAQFSRELVFRPLVVHTIGPFKVERHLYVDESFTNDEDQMIVSAAKEWERKTGGLVTFKIHLIINSGEFITLKDSKAIAITKGHVADLFVYEVEETQGHFLGLHTKRFSTELIILNVDRIDDALALRATTLHEMGHALGLDHAWRKYTLMYPSDDYGAYVITEHDLEQFCLLYFCEVKNLRH